MQIKTDSTFTLQCGCRGRVDCNTGGVGMALCPLHLNASELLNSLKDLQRELHSNFKLDVRKHFRLMTADAQANTAMAKAEGKL